MNDPRMRPERQAADIVVEATKLSLSVAIRLPPLLPVSEVITTREQQPDRAKTQRSWQIQQSGRRRYARRPGKLQLPCPSHSHRRVKRGDIAFLETARSENIGVAADFGEKLSVSDFPLRAHQVRHPSCMIIVMAHRVSVLIFRTVEQHDRTMTAMRER